RNVDVMRVVIVDNRRYRDGELRVEGIRTGRVGGHLAVQCVTDGIRDESAHCAVVSAARHCEGRQRDVREVDERDVGIAYVPGRERGALVNGIPLPVTDRAGPLAAPAVVTDTGLA